MTPAELSQLIQDIEAGPVTRELNDRVLLVLGWTAPHKHWSWWSGPNDEQVRHGDQPAPLNNLEDAKLAVPEGWQWRVTSTGDAETWKRWRDIEPVHAFCPDEPAEALTLAGLKARLAMMEESDD